MNDFRLSEISEDHLEIARRVIEDVLIERRNMGASLPFRNNGLVVKSRDGRDSDIIRLGPEDALRIGLKAIMEAPPEVLEAAEGRRAAGANVTLLS